MLSKKNNRNLYKKLTKCKKIHKNYKDYKDYKDNKDNVLSGSGIFGAISSSISSAVYHKPEKKNSLFLLFIVVFFGLIHGLGFSYLLKSILSKEDSVFFPLLFFNLGLEVGQLLIVSGVLVLSLILAFVLKCPYKLYKFIIICFIGLIALKITIERFIDLF